MLPTDHLALIRRILAETLPAYGVVTERDIERAAVAVVEAAEMRGFCSQVSGLGARSFEGLSLRNGRHR